MLGWKKNKDCPICRAAFADGDATFETPSAHFPGLGKPFGDFLEEDDPLQEICRKRVHVACWSAWPERARFASAWSEWKLDGVRAAPDQGLAWRGDELALAAPADPADPDARVRLFFVKLAAHEELAPAKWPDVLRELAARPLYREALAGADALAGRFPDARALTDAVAWAKKPTPCQICQGILGANPTSSVVYRLPEPEFWPGGAELRALKPFAGALAHTACYLSWPERARFLRAVTDVERRLAKLDAHRVVVPLSDTAFALADVKAAEVELRAGEARVTLGPAWEAAAARPFEKAAIAEAVALLAKRHPTPAALLASIDPTSKELETYQAIADQIDQCRALVRQARGAGLRCPRCVARLNDLLHEEGAGTIDCPRCGGELTPMDFGWLP